MQWCVGKSFWTYFPLIFFLFHIKHKQMWQWSIYCLSALNPPFFALFSDTTAGPCKSSSFPSSSAETHGSVCREPGAFPLWPSGNALLHSHASFFIYSCFHSSSNHSLRELSPCSLATPTEHLLGTNFCLPKPSDKFLGHWQALCSMVAPSLKKSKYQPGQWEWVPSPKSLVPILSMFLSLNYYLQ